MNKKYTGIYSNTIVIRIVPIVSEFPKVEKIKNQSTHIKIQVKINAPITCRISLMSHCQKVNQAVLIKVYNWINGTNASQECLSPNFLLSL